ncbi:MAG: prepilin peptidase [Thermoanaerobaculia bacterium]
MSAALMLDVYAALVGLVTGSYLNVVIHRLPRGESTVTPRSRCPYCGGGIRALDNLPVLSYLVLRGRCRRCGAPISWRYPAFEAATALLFVGIAERFGLSFEALVALVFGCLLLVLAAIDFDHFLLPDRLTLPGIAVGLAVQPWLPRTSFLDAVLGVTVGAGLLILLINFWYWLRQEEGMGLGDVNMLAMVGAFLGWQGALVTFAVATVAGAVSGLALMVGGRLKFKGRLPFGLFLALGALVALFFGERLVAVYAGLL